MTIPLMTGRNYNQDLYNRSLSAAYRVWSRLYDPNYALAREPEAWEKIRRDSTIAQVIDQRLNAVASRTYRVEAASDKPEDETAAAIVEEMIKGIHGFNSARKLLAQAIFRSRAYAYIEGSTKLASYADTVPQMWWAPTRLRDVDPRRIRYRPIRELNEVGVEIIRVATELWSVNREEYQELVHPEYFIKHKYEGESEQRLGYGRGLMDSLYFAWWVRTQVWKSGLEGLERWASGIVIGKVDSFREGSTGKTNEDIRDELLESLSIMKSRHVLVTGKEDEVQVIDGGAPGHQMVVNLLKYLDDAIKNLVLGASMPYGGGEGGSYARAEVEENSSEALVQFDRQKMDEQLTSDLIGLIWYQNRPQFAAIGLGAAKMPHFSSVQEKREDPTVAATIITQMAQAGLPLRLDEVYDRIGFTRPRLDGDDPDEVFEGQAPPMPDLGLPFNATGKK